MVQHPLGLNEHLSLTVRQKYFKSSVKENDKCDLKHARGALKSKHNAEEQAAQITKIYKYNIM